MVGTLNKNEISSVLVQSKFCRLGCYAKGKSYVVPISFALDSENSVVGQTTEGLKISMMRENPNVCLCFDEIEDLTHWRSVIAWGRYQELSGVAAAQAMGLLIDKYGPMFEGHGNIERGGRVVTPPRLDGKPSVAVVYRIVLDEMTGRFENADRLLAGQNAE